MLVLTKYGKLFSQMIEDDLKSATETTHVGDVREYFTTTTQPHPPTPSTLRITTTQN